MSKTILQTKQELKEVITNLSKESDSFSWGKDIIEKYDISRIKEFAGVFSDSEFDTVDLSEINYDNMGSLKNFLKSKNRFRRLILTGINLDVAAKFDDWKLPEGEYDLCEEFHVYLGAV